MNISVITLLTSCENPHTFQQQGIPKMFLVLWKPYGNLHVNYMLKPHLEPSQPNTNTHDDDDKLIMNFI